MGYEPAHGPLTGGAGGSSSSDGGGGGGKVKMTNREIPPGYTAGPVPTFVKELDSPAQNSGPNCDGGPLNPSDIAGNNKPGWTRVPPPP
jgi:hypothetical protein